MDPASTSGFGASLKHPLIFRRRILLRGIVILLNRGNYVEQDDQWTKAWVHGEFSKTDGNGEGLTGASN
jgi:hypothetical protein